MVLVQRIGGAIISFACRTEKIGGGSEYMYSVDWAVKKKLIVYNLKTKKLKELGNDIESMMKFAGSLKSGDSLYLEEGGADSLKLCAFRQGCSVFTIPGKDVKDYRDELSIEKSDKADAVIIGELAKLRPDGWYQFREEDTLTSEIAVLFKERLETEKTMVRAKNQYIALEKRTQFMKIDKGVLDRKKKVIKALDELFTVQTRGLEKRIKPHPLTAELIKIKGVSTVVIAGLIAGIKRIGRFESKGSLRHYAGMIPRDTKENYPDPKKLAKAHRYVRPLKRALYFFMDAVIKQRTPEWRELYDEMKKYYAGKHMDWRKGKVDAHAKKFVERKFLDFVYDTWKGLEV